MTARRGDGGEWEWLLVDAELEATGLWNIREYVRWRKETVAKYVAGRPIYELFKGVKRMERFSRLLRRWYQ